jgi:hypothetical protein
LLLGNDAYESAIAKLHELENKFTTWEHVSRSADFPELSKPKPT